MPMTIPPRRRRPGGGHGGFTVLEVLIALVIVAVLIAAAAQVMLGVGQSQSAHKVRQKQTSAAEAIYERLRSDTGWLEEYGCPVAYSTPCRLSAGQAGVQDVLSDALSKVHGVGMDARVEALAVDSPADGAGPNDADGVRPDYFKVTITVTATGPTVGDIAPFTMSSDINSAQRADVGALLLRTCAADRQIDERIAIATCPVPKALTLMPPADPAGSDVPAWNGAPQTLRQLQVRPIGIGYTLRGPRGAVIKGATAATTGTSMHRGLEPGTWTVELAMPAGYILWASHSIPAGGFATVEAGQRSQLLQMLRVAPVSGMQLAVRSVDSTVPWEPIEYDYAISGASFKMLAAPFGRTALPEESVKIPAGAATVTLPDMEPGLYSARVLNPSGSLGSISPTSGLPYIWVDANAGQPLATYTIGKCDPAGRDALIATYGTGPFEMNGNTYTLERCGGTSTGYSPPPNDGGGGT